MKNLLKAIGLAFIVLGAVVAFFSLTSPGKVLIGLNLGLAATLFVGGFIVLGLGVIADAIDRISGRAPAAVQKNAERDQNPSIGTIGAVGAGAGAAGVAIGASIGSQFDKAADGVDSAIDKVADAASKAKTGVKDSADETATIFEDAKGTLADITADAGKEVKDTGLAAIDTGKAAIEDVADTGDDVTKEVREGIEALSANNEPGDGPEPVEEADDQSPESVVEIKEDSLEDLPQTDTQDDDAEQLYVVEELEVRGKAARVLSDGTVEAETEEGWMRFENTEHLEEYLDAMSG